MATELSDLESRVEEIASDSDEIPPLVNEDIMTLADQIEEMQELVVEDCAQLGQPIYKCSLGGYTLNAGP